MTTLMTWANSGGEKGRCDQKCHLAKGPNCDCMCGGAFHGAGRNGTLETKLKEFGEAILEGARRRAEAEGFVLNVSQAASQRKL